MELDAEKIAVLLKSLTTDELDSILDYRDTSEFEAEYITNTEKYDNADITHPNLETIFIELSNATNQHEIVSYIADDLDSIAAYEQGNDDNGYMDEMIKLYLNGDFPGRKMGKA